MNWKKLSINPPFDACDILVRIDEGSYKMTYLAKYYEDGTFAPVDKYGGAEGKRVPASGCKGNVEYINIDEIGRG